ncbi:MAG TPA: ABC transporter substrate-binding protein [Candidatus Eremiobacteraceae bacterium]|nr:ABC transporter substrate-binding protein [Candidatus Eremiobacteraceae bacterium]
MSKSERPDKSLTRKDFLGGIGVAAAAAAGASTGVATSLGYAPATVADNAPILIGDVDETSGVYAVSGASQSLGKKVCVDEWNARGGVLGRKIQLIHADTAAKPDVAVPNATKLIEQDQVDVLVGEVSSGVGLALSALAQRLGIVYVAAGTHDTTITGSNARLCCFRTTAANSMLANATAKALLPFGKKWFFITPDYAYGHSAQAGFQTVLEANGGQSLGNELTAFPVNSGDFTAQLTKAKNSGADVLVLSWYGGDLVNGLKQYVQLGLDKVFKQVGGPLNGVEVGLGYGPENNRGIWGAPWSPDYPTEGSQQLVAKLKAAGATYVDWRMYLGWLATEAAITGILRAGTTEATRLVHAMEDLTFNGLQKKFCHIRACDHQNELDVVVQQAIPKSQWKYTNQFFKITQIVPASETLEPCSQSDAPAKLATQTIPTREGYTPKTKA